MVIHSCSSTQLGTRPARLAELCAIELLNEGPPEWIPLFPAGDQVKAFDGRKFSNSDPQAVINTFNSDPRDLVIDWEHATEEVDPSKGGQAPAAAWVDRMELRGLGEIWGHVKEWTARGAESVRTREYRYISPGFIVSAAGKLLQIISAALVNRPALHMPALARADVQLAAVWTTAYVNDLPDSAFLYIGSGGTKDSEGKTKPRSLRKFPYKDASGKIDLPHLRNAIARIPQAKGLSNQEKQRLQAKARRLLERQNASQEHTMEPEILKLLGLEVDATPEQIRETVTAMLDKVTAPSPEKLTEDLTEARAENDRLKVELVNARNANPALEKFVPRADYDAVVARAQKAESDLKSQDEAAHAREVEQLVDQAQKAGKITPATREFYVQTCATKEGLANFKKFVEQAPEIAPNDPPPVPPPTSTKQLTAGQKMICVQCGVSEEDFLKSLEEGE